VYTRCENAAKLGPDVRHPAVIGGMIKHRHDGRTDCPAPAAAVAGAEVGRDAEQSIIIPSVPARDDCCHRE